MKKLLASFTLLITLTQGCASLPGAKEPTDADINAEAAKAYIEVKAKSKISTNAEWTAMVQRVSSRIAAASGKNYQWEVVLIESPEVNAWCMPGGKMAVYTGIMPVLKTEGALAAVMGHEVSHATLGHGRKGYAKAIQQQYAAIGLGLATVIGGQLLCKTDNCKTMTMLGGAAGAFAISFFANKYSRGNETEADQSGQIFMAKAGYDPAESIKLWERMSAANGGKAPPEFMSTHPSDANRRANLTSWLPEANRYYQASSAKFGIGEAIR